MKFEPQEEEIINRAVKHWLNEGIVDEATSVKMKESIELVDNNKNVLITFAIVASVSCGLLAFGALIMDEKWIELMRRKYGISEWIVGVLFFAVSIFLVYVSKKRHDKAPHLETANEAFNITIVMSVAIAFAYAGRGLGYQNGNYAIILLLAIIAYACVAVYLKSSLLWVTVMIGLIGWWGAQTYFWSHGADYFLWMNYPLRYTVFGLLLLLSILLIRQIKLLRPFRNISRGAAWLYFLTASWTLSVLGNSNNIETWSQTRQGYFWYWAVSYSVLVIAVAWYGFKKKDAMLRDLGLVFLLINIYTRYFEYFWDKTNKGLFFAILAVSFWWVAKTVEKWRRPAIMETKKDLQVGEN